MILTNNSTNKQNIYLTWLPKYREVTVEYWREKPAVSTQEAGLKLEYNIPSSLNYGSSKFGSEIEDNLDAGIFSLVWQDWKIPR